MRFLSSFLFVALLSVGFWVGTSHAQDRPASPRGEVSTQVGGAYGDDGYEGGSWVVIDYGRPILRGRTDMLGSGDSYGEAVKSGAPVWRAGANKSTRLMTETDLMFGNVHLPAGEYSLFVEPDADKWTLIISSHQAQAVYQQGEGIWGAYGYDESKDVARVEMTLSKAPFSFDQLTYSFVNMTQGGGTLAIMWDSELATVDFMAH